MGFRLFKKVKIAKGVSVNISKSGASLSVGPKGAKVTVNNKGGVTASTGIPGTGISYREKMNPKTKRRKSAIGGAGSCEYVPADTQEAQTVDTQAVGQDTPTPAEALPQTSPMNQLLKGVGIIALKVVGACWSLFVLMRIFQCLFTPDLNGQPFYARIVLVAILVPVGAIGVIPIAIFRKKTTPTNN